MLIQKNPIYNSDLLIFGQGRIEKNDLKKMIKKILIKIFSGPGSLLSPYQVSRIDQINYHQLYN